MRIKKLYKTSNKLFNFNIINEVLDNTYMMPLKRHFDESDKDKWLNNINNGEVTPSSFLFWCINAEKYTEDSEITIKNLTDKNALALADEYNSLYNKIKDFNQRRKKEELIDKKIFEYIKNNYKIFKKYLLVYHGNNIFTDDYRDLRLWNSNCVFKDISVFKNKWVVHFRKNNIAIADKIKGRNKSEMTLLGYIYSRLFNENLDNGGYLFGYLADDLKECSNEDIVSKTSDGYGIYALVLRTSGLRVYHSSDREYQVIFNAANINLKEACLLKIETTGGYYWDDFDQLQVKDNTGAVISIITPYTNNVIYKSTSIEEILDWIDNNYALYRKKLTFSPLICKVILDKIKNNPENTAEIINKFIKKGELSNLHNNGFKQREFNRMLLLFNKYKDTKLYNGKTLSDDFHKKFNDEFNITNLYIFFNAHMNDRILIKDSEYSSKKEYKLKFPEFSKYYKTQYRGY